MPQKHDIGQQKKLRRQQKASTVQEHVSPDQYASGLVETGQASFLILGRPHSGTSPKTPAR